MKSNKGVDPNILEYESMSKVLTERYKHLDWVDRALNPSKYPVKNQDQFMEGGNTVSHKLAYSTDDSGAAWVYPTVVYEKGKLKQLSGDEARYNMIMSGKAIKVPSVKLADYYSKNGLIKHFEKGGFINGGDQPKPKPKPTYQDSLTAYNRDIAFDKEFVNFVKNNPKASNSEIEKVRQAIGAKYPHNNVAPAINRTLESSPTLYTGATGYKVKDQMEFKKPVELKQQPNKFLTDKEYDKTYPPIYIKDKNDPRIGQYTEAGNQFRYKEPPIPKRDKVNISELPTTINPIPTNQSTQTIPKLPNPLYEEGYLKQPWSGVPGLNIVSMMSKKTQRLEPVAIENREGKRINYNKYKNSSLPKGFQHPKQYAQGGEISFNDLLYGSNTNAAPAELAAAGLANLNTTFQQKNNLPNAVNQGRLFDPAAYNTNNSNTFGIQGLNDILTAGTLGNKPLDPLSLFLKSPLMGVPQGQASVPTKPVPGPTTSRTPDISATVNPTVPSDTLRSPIVLNSFKDSQGNLPDYVLRDKKTRTVYEDKPKKKGVLDYVDDVLSAPQRAATWMMTGEYQNPSDALDIENKWAKLATDVVLDPMNLLGVGVVSKTGKAAKVVDTATDVGKAGKVLDKPITIVDDLKNFTPKDFEKWQSTFVKSVKNKDYSTLINKYKEYSPLLKEFQVTQDPKILVELSKRGAGTAIVNDLINLGSDKVAKQEDYYQFTPHYPSQNGYTLTSNKVSKKDKPPQGDNPPKGTQQPSQLPEATVTAPKYEGSEEARQDSTVLYDWYTKSREEWIKAHPDYKVIPGGSTVRENSEYRFDKNRKEPEKNYQIRPEKNEILMGRNPVTGEMDVLNSPVYKKPQGTAAKPKPTPPPKPRDRVEVTPLDKKPINEVKGKKRDGSVPKQKDPRYEDGELVQDWSGVPGLKIVSRRSKKTGKLEPVAIENSQGKRIDYDKHKNGKVPKGFQHPQ